MLWILPAALAQAPTVTEPILSHAQVDDRAMKWRRPFELALPVAPVAFGLGRYAHTSYLRRVGNAEEGAGLAGLWIGSGAGLVGATAPILMMGRAQVSRKALEQQGLQPRRIPRLTGLFSVSAVLISSLGWGLQSTRDPAARRAANGMTATGIGLYGIAVALPMAQLHFNAKARRDAGWWDRKRR